MVFERVHHNAPRWDTSNCPISCRRHGDSLRTRSFKRQSKREPHEGTKGKVTVDERTAAVCKMLWSRLSGNTGQGPQEPETSARSPQQDSEQAQEEVFLINKGPPAELALSLLLAPTLIYLVRPLQCSYAVRGTRGRAVFAVAVA